MKEPIIVLVGFLGAGKTTLLRKLASKLLDNSWDLKIILNDYENAEIDSQGFLDLISRKQIRGLSGSCICCSGLTELRSEINSIQKRDKGALP